MLTKKPQAIAGVSVDYENVVEEIFPSIGSTVLGQFLNRLYESLPGFGEVRLSYLIFVPVTWPLALVAYLALKLFGSRYVLTNRAVKCFPVLGSRPLAEVSLDDINRTSVDPDSRLTFFRSGDIRLSNAGGETLMLLRGIPWPERFCQVIDKTRQARQATAESLATIRVRSR